MTQKTLLLFVIALVAVGSGSWWLGARSARPAPLPSASPTLYQCPMHPSYVSDRPGDCPICGMKLVEVPPGGSAQGSSVAGRASVTLTPERRQVLGIRSEEIHHGPLTRAIRTVGRVAVDERRLHHIHVKYDGYVEHLYVDFTGKYVERGQPLLSIYSPELVASQQEYLLAWKAQQQMADSSIASVAQGSLDFGVITFQPAERGLHTINMGPDELVVLVHPHHPMAGRRQATMAEFGREVVIAHNDPSPARERVLRAFEQKHAPINIQVALPSLEAIKRAVEMRMGVALLPKRCALAEIASGKLVAVRIPQVRLVRQLRLVYRRTGDLSHAAQAFLATAKEQHPD